MSNLYWETAITITQNGFLCSNLSLILILVSAYYLLNSCSHFDNILNTVVEEVPGVLEVRRGILNHH